MPVFKEWDEAGNLQEHDEEEKSVWVSVVRTDAKLARIERTKSGTVLRKAMRTRKNHPIVFFRSSSAGVLLRLCQIYAGQD